MVTNWYAKLLRLYPRAFRERFGESMTQTFRDLSRDRSVNIAWIFFETIAGIIKEHMSELARTALRVALGALAAWMVPFVASRFVVGWNWPAGTFVVVYCLFFLVGMAFAMISKRMGVWSYKAGVGIALFAGFGLGWSNMVHVADSENPANLAYYSVLVVGAIGATLARLRAPGLARTMFAMAAVLALISLLLPSGAPPDMAIRMAIGHVVNVMLFATAGLLFRHANAAATASGS